MQPTGKESLQMRPRTIDVYLCFVLSELVAEVCNRLPRVRSEQHALMRPSKQKKKQPLAAAVRQTGGKKTVPS